MKPERRSATVGSRSFSPVREAAGEATTVAHHPGEVKTMKKLIPAGLVAAIATAAIAVVFAGAGGSAVATGTLTGKITDDVTNQPQAGLCATAVDTAGNFTTAVGDARGNYPIPVPAGPYEVFFSDCGGSPNQYVPEVYKNHPGLDSDRTDAVDVVAGQTAKAN